MKRSFNFGVAVSDYNFIGRERETRRLVANFTEGINTILISPRRIGKTSLVLHVKKQLENVADILIVYLDIFSCRNEYDFYNALSAAVIKQTAPSSDKWMEMAKDFLVRLTPKISFSPEPNSDFSLSLGITPRSHAPEEILQLAEDIAVKRNKHIVVCIDEFQQVGQMPDSVTIQKRLRSTWQHQKNVSYCLFGSRKHLMTGIFEKRNMPFYQFGDMIHLDKIKTEDWVNYIVSHFEDRNKHISSELAQSICTTVSNYSSYVQQLAWLLFCQVEPGESATENQLKIAFDDLLNSNESLFMQQVESLTGYQMNFLRAIVAGIHTKFGEQTIRENFDLGSPSNVARLRNALIEKDLVESREHGELYITDPVFELWFRTKMMH